MKKKFTYTLFFICSLLMMLTPSCSSDNSEETPEIIEIGNFGKIQFDREKFGLGQTVTASCQLPSTSGNISDLTYTWYLDNEKLVQNTISNGVSSVTFTLPSPSSYITTGDYNIELKASTSNTEVKLPAPATATINVQYPDAYLSFWGDNVDLTQKNVPGLTGSNNEYTVTMQDYLQAKENKENMQCTYYFTDNKLSKVDEIHTIASDRTDINMMQFFLSTFKGMITKTLSYYNFTTTQSFISFANQTQKDFNLNSQNSDYNKDDFEIDIFVLGGTITIHAENDNTELVINAVGKTAENLNDYTINCTYTYTPKQ